MSRLPLLTRSRLPRSQTMTEMFSCGFANAFLAELTPLMPRRKRRWVVNASKQSRLKPVSQRSATHFSCIGGRMLPLEATTCSVSSFMTYAIAPEGAVGVWGFAAVPKLRGGATSFNTTGRTGGRCGVGRPDTARGITGLETCGTGRWATDGTLRLLPQEAMGGGEQIAG